MASRYRPRLGRRRSARFAAAPEALDDNHAAAATGARRPMIGCSAGGHVRVALVKYWLSVNDEEQEKRFQDRM